MSRSAITACIAALVVTLAGAASAQQLPPAGAAATDVVGTVVAIDGDDLVVDLGADRGLATGDVVELWRPLKIKHPVTGKVLTDRFRIGALELGQVRGTLSLAHPSGALARAPEKGDVVIGVRRRKGAAEPAAAQAPAGPGAAPPPASAPAAAAPPTASEGPYTEDEEAARVTRLMQDLRGADPWTRIQRYEAYVQAHPQSRYAVVLRDEAAVLRAVGADVARPPRPVALRFQPIGKVLEGQPLRVGVELSELANGAVLHARKRGAPSFASTPMDKLGAGYYAATISGDRVDRADVEYFIEATTPEGNAVPVAGSSDQPLRADVQASQRPTPPSRPVARASVLTDYADYDRLRGDDRAWQTEGEVGIRLGDVGVRAVRTGFGVYRGVGGSVHELDDLGDSGRKVGLTYGYLEGELGIVRSFSFIGRGAVGLLNDGISGGGQLLVRIGSDLKTNLVLGGEVLGGVGLRSIAQMELAVFERVPILLRTEVTNQPAGTPPSHDQRVAGVAQDSGDVGARGIVQLGYRFLPQLTVSGRASFQGRTIKHAGPGFGGGVSYQW